MSNLKSVSSISNLLTCKNSSKNKKFLKLGPEIPYLGIFGLHFNKNYCQIFNQHTQICEAIKEPKICLKFRTKNSFFGCFGQQMIWQWFGAENKNS